MLADGGVILLWNLGISTRLSVGLVLCLVFCFHKVLLQKYDDCQVLICKGYRKDIGLKVAASIMYSMMEEYSDDSCILEIVPSSVVLDKRWFIKCLNRGNDRFLKGVLDRLEGKVEQVEESTTASRPQKYLNGKGPSKGNTKSTKQAKTKFM